MIKQPPKAPADFQLQQDYYARTADSYDSAHLARDPEHKVALAILLSYLELSGSTSLLDVGAGTGRVLSAIRKRQMRVEAIGIEPSQELRAIGRSQHGIPSDQLIDGNALSLKFDDNRFDIVSAFGVLHHVRRPDLVIAEMLRVAKQAIFISDSNNFGQGRSVVRAIKQTINLFGLWRACDWLRTRGKGFHFSEGDGVFYSYSVFNNYRQIRSSCEQVHLFDTSGKGSANLYRSAPHVAVLGIKRAAGPK